MTWPAVSKASTCFWLFSPPTAIFNLKDVFLTNNVHYLSFRTLALNTSSHTTRFHQRTTILFHFQQPATIFKHNMHSDMFPNLYTHSRALPPSHIFECDRTFSIQTNYFQVSVHIFKPYHTL